jgi:hypothetical protein
VRIGGNLFKELPYSAKANYLLPDLNGTLSVWKEMSLEREPLFNLLNISHWKTK